MIGSFIPCIYILKFAYKLQLYNSFYCFPVGAQEMSHNSRACSTETHKQVEMGKIKHDMLFIFKSIMGL